MDNEKDTLDRMENSISAKEAADLLKVTYRWFLGAYIHTEKIKSTKIGAQYWINRDDLAAFIQSQEYKITKGV